LTVARDIFDRLSPSFFQQLITCIQQRFKVHLRETINLN